MKSRYRITMAERPHFLTCTILNWLSIFSFKQFTEIVIDSLAFLQRHDRLVVHGYVIMVNHLHLIARSHDLSKEIGDFKSFTARRIIDELEAQNRLLLLNQMRYFKQRYKPDREYQLWQEGSYPKLIYNEMMMRQKLMYIHNNPVKSGASAFAFHAERGTSACVYSPISSPHTSGCAAIYCPSISIHSCEFRTITRTPCSRSHSIPRLSMRIKFKKQLD